MKRLFAVIRTRGPAWQASLKMEAQLDWTAHADFMTNLRDEGFVLLVGPLLKTQDVLLIIRAESADEITSRLADDPWTPMGLVEIKRIDAWDLRLGKLAW